MAACSGGSNAFLAGENLSRTQGGLLHGHCMLHTVSVCNPGSICASGLDVSVSTTHGQCRRKIIF